MPIPDALLPYSRGVVAAIGGYGRMPPMACAPQHLMSRARRCLRTIAVARRYRTWMGMGEWVGRVMI